MAGVIVVGVDGSAASRAALRWAAEEARLRGAALVALHAWTYVPPPPIGEPGMIPIPAGDLAPQLEAERMAAQAELEAALADAFPEGVPELVEPRLVEGDPAETLEREGASADLVVVGSRGRSGLASVLLGSVTRHVVDHAPCPVVVVKARG
ncbi:MAG TPA: universal stress protein [Gaiellaceae bacterium]|jgi:nucleotide-binding universal stress UspA family protein|nr:universal stress protein [Gaiellaceae bacterium]